MARPHLRGGDPCAYALMSGRRLAFLVDECDAEDLTGVMAQIVGQPKRQEAIKSAIERRSLGQVG